MLTVEPWLLSLFIILIGVGILIPIIIRHLDEYEMISVISLACSSLMSFKVSNTFIDGTLTKTENFLFTPAVGSPEIITHTEVIRNSAASSIFFLLGIFLLIITLLQVYLYLISLNTDIEPLEWRN